MLAWQSAMASAPLVRWCLGGKIFITVSQTWNKLEVISYVQSITLVVTMGFWFGSIVFLLLELVGFFTVKGVYSNQDSRSSRFHKQNTTLYVFVRKLHSEIFRWHCWETKLKFSLILQVASSACRHCSILLLDDVDYSVYWANVPISKSSLIRIAYPFDRMSTK